MAFRTRVSGGDHAQQREDNRSAPVIPHLGRRIAELFAPYRAQLTIIAVLVLITATLGILPPLITQRVFDDALFPGDDGPVISLLVQLVLLIVGIFALSNLLGVVQTIITARVGNQVMGDLRVKLFRHLQRMELAFFTRTKTGVIQSRLQNDVGGVSNVLTNTVSNVVGNTVTVIAAFVAMVLLSWQLTIIALFLMPVLVIAQRRVGQVRARIAGKTQESLSQMTAITQESLSISGMLLTKTYSREPAELARYSDENDRQIHLQVRLTMSGQVFFALVQLFMSAVPAIVYLVSGLLIARAQGEGFEIGITAGTIVAFTTVQSRLLFPMMALMRIALDLQTSKALFARIFEYLDLKPQITERDGAQPPDMTRGGSIEFEAVTFRYADAEPVERPTLSNVSFRVEPGEFVAIVGPSGSGKTTVGSLIPRLYDVNEGSVRFAGDDVRDLTLAGLMGQIGMVTQESYLFHGTIAENLRYAHPEATQEELEAAARMANIHDTIVSFADGYDTVVGERGYRLSGGEKQRIAIARVLLKNPPVLILDEATSALDTVSERIVQGALDDAREGRTTIAIAHRLSTIVDADRILVIRAGEIVQQGTHDELVSVPGDYADLYAQQTN